MSGTERGNGNAGLAHIRNKDPAEKWLFSREELENTPSRRDNVTAEKELNYRQQAANLIQDMGQRLPVNQLTINTAIVYMHRFYIFHSFQAFSRFLMAPTALFLAAKVEEQPRKLEHVIKVCHSCLHPDKPHLDVHSDAYLKQAQELVQNELIMLQSLGFDISIDHPHTHVVKCTQLVKASRDLSQMAYFMATNSLHLTTFCLKYKPTVVSAMCIHLSCKWSNYEIPLSSTGRAYWTYMDATITEALLENIINEFLQILNLCPTRLRKLKNYKPSQRDGGGGSTPSSKDGQQHKPSTGKGSQHGSHVPQQFSDSHHPGPSQSEQLKKHTSSLTLLEYKHKREKELQTKHVPEIESDQKSRSLKLNKKIPPNVHQHQRHPQHLTHANQRSLVHAKPGQRHPDKVQIKGEQLLTHGNAQNVHTALPSAHIKQEKLPPQNKAAGAHEQRRPVKTHPQKHHPPGIPGLQRPKSANQQGPNHEALQSTHRTIAPQQKSTKEHHSALASASQTHHKPHSQPQVKAMQRVKPQQSTLSQGSSPGSTENEESDIALKGMEMKIMEQMKAEKTCTSHAPRKGPEVEQSASLVSTVHQSKHSRPEMNHHTNLSVAKDVCSHPATEGSGQTQPAPNDTKSLYEQYKKTPDVLRHNLKRKAQSEALNDEEKMFLHKLKKKEEERQRRKRDHKKHKSHQSQLLDGANMGTSGEVPDAPSPSGGGPLTVRIKLPPSVRAEMSQNQGPAGSAPAGKPIASSSGSGSEATVSSPGGTAGKSGRKRAHGHDSSGIFDPTAAKQSRKSDSHHHSSHHGSHESSRSGKHRHSKSNSHHHHHHHSKPANQSNQKIDEAVFQRALEDAVTMVQCAQSAPGTSGSEATVPTVTLKRTGIQNGEQEKFVAHHASKHDGTERASFRRKHGSGFDPSAPVPSTLPDELFEGEDESMGNHKPATRDLSSRNADLSSPEVGEIRDDEDDEDASPPREHHFSAYYGGLHRRGTSEKIRGHHHHRRDPTNGGMPPPPNLTHGAWSGASYDSETSKGHERLPPLPTLTVKPDRPMDLR